MTDVKALIERLRTRVDPRIVQPDTLAGEAADALEAVQEYAANCQQEIRKLTLRSLQAENWLAVAKTENDALKFAVDRWKIEEDGWDKERAAHKAELAEERRKREEFERAFNQARENIDGWARIVARSERQFEAAREVAKKYADEGPIDSPDFRPCIACGHRHANGTAPCPDENSSVDVEARRILAEDEADAKLGMKRLASFDPDKALTTEQMLKALEEGDTYK